MSAPSPGGPPQDDRAGEDDLSGEGVRTGEDDLSGEGVRTGEDPRAGDDARHGDEAERFVPETMSGGILEAEHRVRYELAATLARGRRVLDAGCGVGWGSAVLLDAGAVSATAFDLDAGAVDDARSRVPGAHLLRSDLMATGLAGGSFDLVVCFEALEHAADPSVVLDELVRLLADDGVLLVSSPNPAVYPAGNPHHVHELGPEELLAAVAARLPHTRLWHQQALVASIAVAAGDPATTGDGPVDVAGQLRAVVPLGSGHDPYSLVVASRRPLAPMAAVAVTAPSEQLDHLDELARALGAEREALHRDHARIVAERAELQERLAATDAEVRVRGDALDELRARLVDADAGMRRLTDDARRLAEALDHQRHRTEAVARDRDRFAADLVAAEQALAVRSAQLDDERDELARLRAEHERSVAVQQAQQAELDATLATVSWRVTAPLRTVRRRVPRA